MFVFFWLSCLVAIFSLMTYLFPWWYVFELSISFAPYIVLINFFFLLYWIGKRITKLAWFTEKRKRIVLLLIVIHTLLVVIFGYAVFSFYTVDETITQYTVENRSGTTILFANMYKDNVNYTGLVDVVEDNNPDIVLFVEFAEHHDENIRSFLTERYPYVNRTTRSALYIGSMVFSRYPVEQFDLAFERGQRRYGYVRVESPNPYYLYLVHTSAPVSPLFYRMRNDQLLNFAADMHEQDSTREEWIPVIVMWDFNVTPWSPLYSSFHDILGNEYINITRYADVLFSWSLHWFSFLQAHIDHIWMKWVFPSSFKKLTIPGSDHDGYIFTVP